ncbi:MAG: hypothetical protein AB1814_16295 [Thermodesulfobacteriota bacterium]
MKKALLTILALILALTLLLPAVVRAAGAYDDVDDIESLKSRLEKLRVFYTDDHPSIQQLLRVLKRAQARETQTRLQNQSKALAEALPRPLPGWRVLVDEGQPDPSLDGVGDGAKAWRSYVNLDGSRVRVELLTDSLSVRSLIRQLRQPGPAASEAKDKIIVWKQHKALIAIKGPQAAELLTLINQKVLLKVSVQYMSYPENVAIQYADAVDLYKVRQAAP